MKTVLPTNKIVTMIPIGLSAVLGLTSMANAATIGIFTNGFFGDSSGFTASSDSVTSGTRQIVFTRTADLDGNADGDDTLTFTVNYEMYIGSTVAGNTVTLGTQVDTPGTNQHLGQGWSGGPAAIIDTDLNSLQEGDTIRLFISSLTYSSNNGSGTDIASFNGFSEFDSFGGGSADFLLGAGGGTRIAGIDAGNRYEYKNLNVQDLYATADATGNEGGRLRNLEFSFEVSAVPEPSSAALLGLGGLALILRRRK